MALIPLQIPTPGGLELAVILLIAILLFGAQKIPKLARSTGQAMGEFRRGREEIEQELEELEGSASLDDTGTAQTGNRPSQSGSAQSASSQDASTESSTDNRNDKDEE